MPLTQSGAGHRRRVGSAVLCAGAMICGWGLVGCAGLSGSSSTATRAFVQQVHSQAPDISSYKTNSQLVKIGQGVCNQFSAKATVEQVADKVAPAGSTSAMPSEDLGAVINSAVQSLCPKYASVLGTSSGSSG